MKKNRNAFFNENYLNYQGFDPNNGMMPFQGMAQNSAFYAGNMPIMNNEINERMAKIERQINRLEHRLSKLENNTVSSSEDYESSTNNMYMI